MNVSATAFAFSRNLLGGSDAKKALPRELQLNIRLNFWVISKWIKLLLTKDEEVANLPYVCLHDNRRVVKIPLLLLGLLRQNVAVVGVLTLNLPRAGKLETLLGG